MNKIFLALAAAALSVPAAAQSETLSLGARGFESIANQAIQGHFLRDSFGGIPECAIVDAPAFRPWTLTEARRELAPCFEAGSRRYQSRVAVGVGFVTSNMDGKAAQAGLVIETALAPGGEADRALNMSIARRGGKLMGQPVRVLARGEEALAPVSALQNAVERCMTVDVVRPLRDGADFLGIYGDCLTSDRALGIRALRPAGGLAVAVDADSSSSSALNGYVTANAGEGPVRVMVFVDGGR